MKQLIAALGAVLMYANAQAQAPLYKITLQAPQYKSGIAFLTYHMGKNLNIEDSAAVNAQGTAIFTSKKKLPGGIYAVVFPGKTKSVDFLVDKEQIITIKVDTTDLLNKTVVTGSPANQMLLEYQKVTAQKGAALEREKQAFAAATTKADSLLHESNFNKANQDLNNYRDQIILKHPKSMMAALLTAMKDPKLPIAKAVTHNDSLENYYSYRSHFWDGVTFTDDRIIRTPFFLPKLERYYRELMVPDPDSIIQQLDYHLLLARTSPEMYKFLLNWATDEYINPKYMGQDKIFVHLFEKYHSKGISNWLNEKQLETISRRAYMVMSNLIGAQAADLEMVDTASKPQPLYSVPIIINIK